MCFYIRHDTGIPAQLKTHINTLTRVLTATLSFAVSSLCSAAHVVLLSESSVSVHQVHVSEEVN